MNVDLDRERAFRQAEQEILGILEMFPDDEQLHVLARVTVAVQDALEAAAAKTAARKPTKGSRKPRVAPSTARLADDGTSLWLRILKFCEQYPSVDGRFRTADLTDALLPKKAHGAERSVAMSTVFTAVRRKSVGKCDEPLFFELGKGRFRLATPQERAVAQEGSDKKA